jgi:hypothetical protein
MLECAKSQIAILAQRPRIQCPLAHALEQRTGGGHLVRPVVSAVSHGGLLSQFRKVPNGTATDLSAPKDNPGTRSSQSEEDAHVLDAAWKIGEALAHAIGAEPHPCLFAGVYVATSQYATQNSGPSGSPLLSRRTLSFPASCRFIPAHCIGDFASDGSEKPNKPASTSPSDDSDRSLPVHD